MKTVKILVILFFVSGTLMAQSKKYIEAMQENITSLNEAQAPDDFDPVINKFSRIGQAEKDQWEPYYYAAQGHVYKSFRISDLQEKDAVLDQALKVLKSGAEVSENNVEIIAMEGFINMIKISVDPGTRGQMLSPIIMASFSKALQMDPQNPRANLFMGQMQMGTAQFFGTGIEEPCKMINKSLELFDKEQSDSPLAPAWGKEGAMQFVEACAIKVEN